MTDNTTKGSDLLDCKICFLPFNQEERKPRALPCGHSFCERCALKLYENEGIQCPFDNRKYKISFDKISINYSLMQMLPAKEETASSQLSASGMIVAVLFDLIATTATNFVSIAISAIQWCTLSNLLEFLDKLVNMLPPQFKSICE